MSALSVYPCYEDDCLEEFSVADNIAQDEHKKDADPCTPFCVSACCAIHAFFTPQVNAVTVIQSATIQNSTYTVKFTPLVIVSIWQPPKLA
jgi:hypothetical protein